MLSVNDVRSWGGDTETADTVIRRIIPFVNGLKTVLALLIYTSGGTAHTVTVFKPFSKTTLSAAAAASQAVINLTADPGVGTVAGAIAANDKLLIEKPDGTLHYAVVQSVSTLAITLTASVPSGGFDAGARVWFYGVAADRHPSFAPATSATTTYAADEGLVAADGVNEPLFVESSNATAAGTIRTLTAHYVRPSSP